MHSPNNKVNNYIGSALESLTLHSKLPAEANFVQTEEHNQKAVQAALKVMDRHLSALNELDKLALASTLHFPHFRLVGTSLKIWETADKYLDDFKTRVGENWAYTKLSPIIPISATTNKVHLDVQVNRFNAQDQLITDFKSIWVITEIGGVWAAQLRSSFAPA